MEEGVGGGEEEEEVEGESRGGGGCEGKRGAGGGGGGGGRADTTCVKRVSRPGQHVSLGHIAEMQGGWSARVHLIAPWRCLCPSWQPISCGRALPA